MTEQELDVVYTRLCHTMTQFGEAHAPLFLARLALLAFDRLGDAAAAHALIDAAAAHAPGDAAAKGLAQTA
jgi:hypothetical protein